MKELGVVQSRNWATKGAEMGHCFCLQSLRKPSKDRRKKQRLEVRHRHQGSWTKIMKMD